MKFFIGFLLTFFCYSLFALAQDAQPPVVEVPLDTFLNQVLGVIAKFGGLSTVLKISAVVGILVASLKVSFFRQFLWAKLGAGQVLVAPFLGLLAGLLDMANAGQVTLVSVVAYIGAGAGAILLHQLLDGVKKLGWVGDKYKAFIDWVMSLLKADKSADQ